MNEVLHSRRTFSVFLIFFGVDAVTNNGYYGGEISVHVLRWNLKSTAMFSCRVSYFVFYWFKVDM